MSIYDAMAWEDGSLGTIWGPCMDGTERECSCRACQNADRIEAEGRDFDHEYETARLRDFDRDLQ